MLLNKKNNLIGALVITLGVASFATTATAGKSPFDNLLGTWDGKGSYELKDGKKVNISCKGYYTGGGAELGMSVLCSTDKEKKIEMRNKLKYADGKVTGTWEERNFNAEGNFSGTAKGKKLDLAISGAVKGKMNLFLSGASQTIKILTSEIDLKSVDITLKRLKK